MDYLFLLNKLFEIAQTPICIYDSQEQCVLELARTNKLLKNLEFRQKIKTKLQSNNPLIFAKFLPEPLDERLEVAAILLPDGNIVYIEATSDLSIELRQVLNCVIEIIYWSLFRLVNQNIWGNQLGSLAKNISNPNSTICSKIHVNPDFTVNLLTSNYPSLVKSPSVLEPSLAFNVKTQEETAIKSPIGYQYEPMATPINNVPLSEFKSALNYLLPYIKKETSFNFEQDIKQNPLATLHFPEQMNAQFSGELDPHFSIEDGSEFQTYDNLSKKEQPYVKITEKNSQDIMSLEQLGCFESKYDEQYLEQIKAKFKHNYTQMPEPHNSYSYALSIFDAVQVGDVERALRAFDHPAKHQVGRMGSTSLQHFKTMVIIVTTLAARAVIKGSMPADKAFSLAEHWFFECELCNDPSRLEEMLREIVIFFAISQKIHLFNSNSTKNKIVLEAIDYIERHIFDDLKVKTIAKVLGVSSDHLQRLFKQELKVNISDKILEQKIKSAQDLICNTNLKFTEIATLLNFCSSSYFDKCFKKITNQTPTEYKKRRTILHQLKS